jgi:hypothetical protein
MLTFLVAFAIAGCGSSSASSGGAAATIVPTPSPTPVTVNCKVNLRFGVRFPGTQTGITAVTRTGSGSSGKWTLDADVPVIAAGIGGGPTARIELTWSRSVVGMSISFGEGVTGYVTNPTGLNVSADGVMTTFTNVVVQDSLGQPLDSVDGTVDCSGV